jgi:abortive infection bacteriophage resistance protein
MEPLKRDLKAQQPAFTISEQIENLKALGLQISDEEFASSFLNDVSYFRFIKAYSLGLKPTNGCYRQGVSFEQLVELYRFNSNFRNLLFPEIEKIEINLRCRLSNYFSLKYGVLGYKDAENFANYPDSFVQEMQKEINRNNRTPFIRNFKQNYIGGDVPCYALVEILSFGMLSKFYKNMTAVDKKQVAATYNVSYTYFESWIESIAYVRNVCAHYGRLYNAKFTKKPKLYKQDIDSGISNSRVMGTLVCLKYLLPHDRHWMEFLDTLELLLEKYPHVQKDTMGFPENWREILMG